MLGEFYQRSKDTHSEMLFKGFVLKSTFRRKKNNPQIILLRSVNLSGLLRNEIKINFSLI